MKICSRCGGGFPATAEHFHADKGKKDGLVTTCKPCRREYQMEYRHTIRGFITRIVAEMKYRCTNPRSSDYSAYGGRGIKLYFTSQELYRWVVIHNIDPRGKETHRVDGNGDYTLGNIEFLTKSDHAKLHRLRN